jgi:hypothetical protein
VGVLAALVSGAIVWQSEKDHIDQSIIIKTENGFKRLNNHIRPLLNRPKDLDATDLKKALVEILSRRENVRIGQYVWIAVYTLEGRPVASAKDEAYENADLVKSITGEVRDTGSRHGKMVFDIRSLNRVPHIQIVAALYNEYGEKAAFETMARELYDTYAGRGDDGLKTELDAIIKKYFYA